MRPIRCLLVLVVLMLAATPAVANPAPPPLLPPISEWWPAVVALAFIGMGMMLVNIWRRSSNRWPNEPQE